MTLKDLIKIALAVGVFSVGVELYAADPLLPAAQTTTPTLVGSASR
jgi:hypothetical protein